MDITEHERMTTSDAKPAERIRGRRRRSSRHRSRRSSAGAALLAMLLGFFLAGLLDARAIDRDVRGAPLSAQRTIQLALLKPMVALSGALRFDRPGVALDEVLRRGSEGRRSLDDVAAPEVPKWPRAITSGRPLKVLIIGDSMAQVFGSSLKNQAEKSELVSARLEYKVSSGLSRPDFYDWPQRMIAQLASINQDATVVMFGANDGQNVAYQGKVLKVGSDAWRRLYQQRVAEAMKILTANGRRVYWVGNPIMRDREYADVIAMMNGVYEEEAAHHPGVTYIDTWTLFADKQGRYVQYLRDDEGTPVLMRGADGIHLTRAGGDRAALHALSYILRDWGIAEADRQ